MGSFRWLSECNLRVRVGGLGHKASHCTEDTFLIKAPVTGVYKRFQIKVPVKSDGDFFSRLQIKVPIKFPDEDSCTIKFKRSKSRSKFLEAPSDGFQSERFEVNGYNKRESVK